MGDSSDSVSIDIDMIPLGGKVTNNLQARQESSTCVFLSLNLHFFLCLYIFFNGFSFASCFGSCMNLLQECVVNTSKGSVSVLVCGDQGKPALITYPDVALNCMLLLLFFCFLPMIYLDLKLNACSWGSWNGYFYSDPQCMEKGWIFSVWVLFAFGC